jgi:DNA-binding transcriptional ArsR family regulator
MIDIKQRILFQVEPWFEVFFALQTLTDENSRIHEVWKRQALLKLPQTFQKKFQLIGASPYIWASIADLLLDVPLTLSFEKRLSALQRISSQSLQKILFEGVFHEPDPVKHLLSGKFDLNQTITQVSRKKREWLAFIGLYPPRKTAPLFKGLEMLLRTPADFLKIVVELINIFWEKEFKETWNQISKKLEHSKEEKERLFQSCTFQEFANLALLRVELDERKEQLRAVRGGYVLPVKYLSNAIILPSAFNDKRHWTCYDQDPTKVTAFFPYFDPSISLSWISKSSSESSEPELDPALIFKALGDTTRYAMVSLIAKEPLTSSDLAKTLSLTRPTVSHHIHVLREAGLIDEKVQGNALLLSLRKEVFESLSDLVNSKLFKTDHTVSYRKTRKK